MLAKFGWQDGYSAFSVGHSQLAVIEKYIAGQKEHHRERIFEDEMRAFYRKNDITFDEKLIAGFHPTLLNISLSGTGEYADRFSLPY